MRNYFRVLKYSWAYRRRLILSCVAAILVAIFWGLNLSAIYPVLKILGGGKNLHEWVDAEIRALQDKTGDPKRKEEIEVLEKNLKLHSDINDNNSRNARDKLADLQGKLENDNSTLVRYQWLQKAVIRHLPEDRFATLVWIMIAVVIGVALKGVFEFWQEWLVGSVVTQTLFDLRNQFFRAVLHQDFRQHAEAGTPELMSRFTNDAEQLGQGLKLLYGRVVLEPLKALTCVAVACFISWQLTLAFMFLVAFAFLFLNKFSRLMKKATRRVLERMSDIYKILREVFDGIKVVKAFTTEAHERRRFRRVTNDYYHKSMRVITLDAIAGPVVELLGVAAVGFALCAGAYLVLNKQTRLFGTDMVSSVMGFEALLQLYILLAAIAEPVRKLSSVYSKIQTAAVASDRVFALFDRTPAVRPNALGPRLEHHSKSIEFRNVCFSYLPGAETLVEINLNVKAGETIALVGPNGCGKSTLLGLIPRFYDPDFGAILIDGIPLRTANLRSLRKQVGLVTQDTVLFDDTIYANIAYGKPGATKEEIEEASKRAYVHEFVVTLPQGYDTPVGEMGSKLSGGQKQRIALARAMIRDPRILILDEFTSQIDSESEAKIHLALREFVKGRTTFLITHRTAALDLADRIVIMDAGRVVAVGTHTDLLATSAEYRRLRDTSKASPTVQFVPPSISDSRETKLPETDKSGRESTVSKGFPSEDVTRSEGVEESKPAVLPPPVDVKAEIPTSKAA